MCDRRAAAAHVEGPALTTLEAERIVIVLCVGGRAQVILVA